jgi:bacterioferritin-associated ferredoxin
MQKLPFSKISRQTRFDNNCKCDRFAFIIQATIQTSTNQPSPTMIVCVCRRISDREIARHARAGMGFDEIQFELGVATQCGQCEGCARDVVAQCSATCPTANIKLANQPLESSPWNSSQPSSPPRSPSA